MKLFAVCPWMRLSPKRFLTWDYSQLLPQNGNIIRVEGREGKWLFWCSSQYCNSLFAGN